MMNEKDKYFTLNGYKQQHLINKRQQNTAIPVQSFDLPPLSQLLPSAPPNQLAFTNDGLSQFINDPNAAVTAMNFMNQQSIAQEEQKDRNNERQHQFSNSSQASMKKQYSFITIPGVDQRKRPRRRYEEIERLYHCNWSNCTKSYGTLNHLNAHISMQKHGPKRQPDEFREMRKEWRRQKKERDSQRQRQEDYSFYLRPSTQLIPFN